MKSFCWLRCQFQLLQRRCHLPFCPCRQYKTHVVILRPPSGHQAISWASHPKQNMASSSPLAHIICRTWPCPACSWPLGQGRTWRPGEVLTTEIGQEIFICLAWARHEHKLANFRHLRWQPQPLSRQENIGKLPPPPPLPQSHEGQGGGQQGGGVGHGGGQGGATAAGGTAAASGAWLLRSGAMAWLLRSRARLSLSILIARKCYQHDPCHSHHRWQQQSLRLLPLQQQLVTSAHDGDDNNDNDDNNNNDDSKSYEGPTVTTATTTTYYPPPTTYYLQPPADYLLPIALARCPPPPPPPLPQSSLSPSRLSLRTKAICCSWGLQPGASATAAARPRSCLRGICAASCSTTAHRGGAAMRLSAQRLSPPCRRAGLPRARSPEATGPRAGRQRR